MAVMDVVEKITLGKHRGIERFGIGFCIIFLILLVAVVLSLNAQYQKDKLDLSDRVVYSSKFETSLSQVKGTVEGVGISTDKTKFFMLMKMEDMKNLPTDAAMYQMFLTGVNLKQEPESLQSRPAGCIYVFGSSGYIGIYLMNANEWPSQILYTIMRNTRNLAAEDNVRRNNVDQSFVENDQWKLYYNPGGDAAKVLDVLDTDGLPKPEELYEACVLRVKEQELRDKLNDDLVKMQNDLKLIDEYTDRVVRDGIVVNPAPREVGTDEVIKNENDKFILKSDTKVEGGYDFAWRDHHLTDTYEDAVRETESDFTDSVTLEQYMATKAKEKIANRKDLDVAVDDWTLTDGTTLADVKDASASRYKTLSDDVRALKDAWSAYVKDKTEYEKTDLAALLELEVELSAVAESATMNYSKEALYYF